MERRRPLAHSVQNDGPRVLAHGYLNVNGSVCRGRQARRWRTALFAAGQSSRHRRTKAPGHQQQDYDTRRARWSNPALPARLSHAAAPGANDGLCAANGDLLTLRAMRCRQYGRGRAATGAHAPASHRHAMAPSIRTAMHQLHCTQFSIRGVTLLPLDALSPVPPQAAAPTAQQAHKQRWML
jgi:hypothetical protein